MSPGAEALRDPLAPLLDGYVELLCHQLVVGLTPDVPEDAERCGAGPSAATARTPDWQRQEEPEP